MAAASKRAQTNKGARKKRPRVNPLLGRWRTPFGIAPFAKIEPRHFEPALKLALKEHRAEIKKIARQRARPTFANTIRALEASGELLNRVADVFFNLCSADTNEELQRIERKMAPAFSHHESAIYLDQALFRRIDTLFGALDGLGLGEEEARVLERTHTAFVRRGARLKSADRKRVAQIRGRLAELVTQFSQNVLADEQSWHLLLESEADLAGLPETVRSAAAQAAEALGHKGKHAITLARSSVESFLHFSARRDLREEAFKAWTRRGETREQADNRPLISEIVALRSELAQLLGFESYARYALDDTMARTPEAVKQLLTEVWPHAVRKASKERDALQKIARREGGNFAIEAWDWRYYAEKERKARYDLDEGEIRSYLQLENVIRAAFDCAHRLFGVTFAEHPEVKAYHPDVRVWEVTSRRKEHVGLFLGDYLARSSKRSGAWMSSFRPQHKLNKGSRPIIVNVMNFASTANGEPVLLSFDDARTLFHEFGHALHGLLSDVTYPSISGTSVARDFVELPSQLFEQWLGEREVLKRFALHYRTGEPMPDDLIDRLETARGFNQGFATVEYTASALVDLELHELAEPAALDVSRFEHDALRRIGMPPEIVMRHRLPHFLHIVGGYAAGYYSYLWSEVMDADAFAAFKEAGDIYDQESARKLERFIYSAGNRRDPQQAYVAFRGRMPDVAGLLRKRGFV